MGRHAVRTAMAFDFVDEIVVADRDGERAASFADQCGDRAASAQVDVENTGALDALLSGADVVLNTVGPFYRLGVPVLRAAIDAGCHYFDINDDWEPTLEMLILDDEARKAGITAVIGIGASPGISNLLAVKAMNELDTIEDLITGWSFAGEVESGAMEGGRGTGSEAKAPSAALVHWMHQCSGKIRVFREGRFVDMAPIEEMYAEVPGVARGAVWSVGHPEAVTLPRFRGGIRNCHNVMTGPRWIIDAVRDLAAQIDAGTLTAFQAAQLLLDPAADAASRRSAETEPPGQPRLPPLFASANGTRNGKPASVGSMVLGAPAGGMGGATGIPLAVALSLFAEGKIDRRGVSAPETAIDPDTFFDALAPLCSPPLTGARDMVLVNTSA